MLATSFVEIGSHPVELVWREQDGCRFIAASQGHRRSESSVGGCGDGGGCSVSGFSARKAGVGAASERLRVAQPRQAIAADEIPNPQWTYEGTRGSR